MKPNLKRAFKTLPKEVQQAFRDFGRIGGKIGGKKGGKVRAKRMTAEQRREAARKAVQARWKRAKKARSDL
jgi:hypothetical protein